MKALALALVAMSLAVPAARAAQNPEPSSNMNARSAFLDLRQPQTAPVSKNGPATAKRASKSPAKKPASKPATTGLGVTIFRKGDGAAPVRVAPSSTLQNGDSLRIAVEPGVDGFLYVFNTDDAGGQPVMIFPDPLLDGGSNRVSAGTVYEVPSRRNSRQSLQWMVLRGTGVTDRIVCVVAREPLPDIPSGKALSDACGAKPCAWPVPARIWRAIESRITPPAVANTDALAMTETEEKAASRTLRLEPNDPAPSFVALSAGRAVFTFVDLKH